MIRRHECKRCKGHGEIEKFDAILLCMQLIECPACYGTGIDENREGFEEMGVEE